MQRPVYAGKGGSYSNGVLSWHMNINVWCYMCAMLSSLTGCADPHLLALGWKREQAAGQRAGATAAHNSSCPPLGFPHRQGDDEGGITLMLFGFSICTLECICFFPLIIFSL